MINHGYIDSICEKCIFVRFVFDLLEIPDNFTSLIFFSIKKINVDLMSSSGAKISQFLSLETAFTWWISGNFSALK